MSALYALPEVRLPIRQIVDGAVDAADEVAYGMRTTIVAVAASLDALGAAAQHNLLRVLQIAATSACLTAMLAQPEKASCYEEVGAAIAKLS